jgi:rhomboid protease GluP
MSIRNNSSSVSSANDRLSGEEKADLVCLGLFPSSQSAHQAGTVILTQNFWYAVFPLNGRWGLYVRSAIAEEAAKLVEQNLNENNTVPPSSGLTAPPPKPVAPWHLIPAPLFLMIIFAISTSGNGLNLVEAGRFDSLRIQENGEWWRLISPLFLHADIAHLFGNISGGLFFGGLLASRIGAAKTYLVALISGIAGNCLNLLTFRNTPYLSIGASTAVFGLLGALTGLRLREMLRDESRTQQLPVTRRHSRRIRYGVLGAGLVLLGWMGTGGERTDIPAHGYGFISGLLLMFFSTARKLRNSSGSNQHICAEARIDRPGY